MICWRNSLKIGGEHLKPQCMITIRRWKKKTRKKYTKPGTNKMSDPSAMALKYFDETYRAHFGKQWPMIRLGLLSPHKYGALINNYTAAVDKQTMHIDKLKRFGTIDMMVDAKEKMRHHERRLGDDDIVGDQVDQAIVQNNLRAAEGNSHGLPQEEIKHGYQQITPIETHLETTEQLETSENIPEEDKKWWEDKFIIAPGYENKMESFLKNKMASDGGSNPMDHSSDIKIIQKPFYLNDNLKCYIHPDDGNVQKLPSVKNDPAVGLQMHYAMDAASILPVLALDLQPDDVVLDMCAAPGGKMLAMVQHMCVGAITANEKNKSRRQRLRQVLNSYVPKSLLEMRQVGVTMEDGCEMGDFEPNSYDKVLVDVPCTTDRVSASSPTDNLFNLQRTKERHDLPKLQKNLLCSALQAVKPGGDVVYSTCTLSQLQNDDVIESALSTCRAQLKINVAVVDLSPLTSAFNNVFHFWRSSSYGQLVIPGLRRNFGPMYFCRLHRLK